MFEAGRVSLPAWFLPNSENAQFAQSESAMKVSTADLREQSAEYAENAAQAANAQFAFSGWHLAFGQANLSEMSSMSNCHLAILVSVWRYTQSFIATFAIGLRENWQTWRQWQTANVVNIAVVALATFGCGNVHVCQRINPLARWIKPPKGDCFLQQRRWALAAATFAAKGDFWPDC
jgi:hypothetical protein